jgi:predicted DNA-binding transcriptional regulator AlpA
MGEAMNSVSKIDRLWSVEDVSEYLGIPVNTLYQWRYRGQGPAAIRVGRYIRYRSEVVRAWVDSLQEKSA